MIPSDSRSGGSGGDDERFDPDDERFDPDDERQNTDDERQNTDHERQNTDHERLGPAVEWRHRVEDLLYEGESVEGSATFENGSAAVVTSHRLLAFEPNLDGPNFERVDRPNVEGVDTGVLSDPGLLWSALQWGFVGAVCLGAGFALGLDSTLAAVDLPTASAGEMGLDGLTGFLETVLDLFALLDDALLVFGLLFAAYAAVLAARYARDRDRTLVVEVAGRDDVHLSRPAESTDARTRLEVLLGIRPGDVGIGGDGPADGLDGGRTEEKPSADEP